VRDALGNALDLGPYPTTCTIIVWDTLKKCPRPWALPYYMYYPCVGPIWGFGPQPWALPYYKYYLCIGPIRGFGNALYCGPYRTTCTILAPDPLEGLEMPSTLGLTYMYYPRVGLEMPLTLGPYPTSRSTYYLCAGSIRGFGNALRHCALLYYYMVLSLCKAQ
jgi:hypothetical protein